MAEFDSMRNRGLRLFVVAGVALSSVVLVGLPPVAAQTSNDILVPSGYQVTQYATGFTTPTAFDRGPNGDLYVLDSGSGFGSEQGAPARNVKIWKVTNGQSSFVYNGDTQSGLSATALGIAVKDDNTIFVNDGKGMNVVHKDGSVQHLFDLPNLGDHANDHIAIGADNKIYWGEGSATNASVVGSDDASLGWLKNHPTFHDIPCKDVTLSGQNFMDKDVIGPDPNAMVMTGPYLPFKTPATAGQVIPGQVPCTSSVMRANFDGSGLEMVAWGFRNPFGVGFAPTDGALKGSLVVANNGADVRGARPIESDGDDLFVVSPGAWYGWPDSLDEQPVTEPRFAPSDPKQAGVPFALSAPTPDQALSALTHFQKGVSADGFAFSTSDAFGWKGDLFIAEWGALGFGLQPPHGLPGFDVWRVNFDTNPQGVLVGANKSLFLTNKVQGSAATLGLNGLDHPIDVRFSTDGNTMYVLDYGPGKTGSGRIWAVTRTGSGQPGGAAPPNASAPQPTPAPTPAPAAAAPAAPSAPAATATPAAAAQAPAPNTVNVAMQNIAFSPQTVTVPVGTTVTWTNNDQIQHTVTWDDRSVDSGLLSQGDTFSHTFTDPGTYGYFCIPHGSPGTGMFGTVVVVGS